MLTDVGFRRVGATSSFERELGARWQSLNVQIDKYGWQAWAGGCFTVEFAWYDEPARHGTPSPVTEWPALATDVDLAAARALQESIREDVPKVQATGADLALAVFWEDTWNDQAGLKAPYRQDSGVGLRYRRPEHVVAWGEFFAARLIRMLEDFDSGWSIERTGESWPWWRDARDAERLRDEAFAALGMTRSMAAVSEQLRHCGEVELADWASTLDSATCEVIWSGLPHPDQETWRRQVAERAQEVLEGFSRPLRDPQA